MKKSPAVAIFLSFFPGFGHIYLGRTLRGLFYMATTIGPVLLSILFVVTTNDDDLFGLSLVGLFFYFISFIDLFIKAAKKGTKVQVIQQTETENTVLVTEDSERFRTILLSFIPGLGHFQLGLMNRGMTLLTAFLGLGIMIFFVSVLTYKGEFLIFLAILPVIWVYGFFDVVQQLNKKQRGEELIDSSILEDFEKRRETGKKSKSIATLLAIFPGAGHLYLGLQRRGIQLMAAFLFTIYILDFLRLGVFLFLIPIIWFYSFFDGLQKASKYGNEPLEDTPVISYLINHQKWVGIGLVLLGIYYLTTNIIIPAISPMLYTMINIDLRYWFDQYFQTGVVCLLLIGGGFKLLLGNKAKNKESVKYED